MFLNNEQTVNEDDTGDTASGIDSLILDKYFCYIHNAFRNNRGADDCPGPVHRHELSAEAGTLFCRPAFLSSAGGEAAFVTSRAVGQHLLPNSPVIGKRVKDPSQNGQ